MADTFHLERFVEAQGGDATYDRALGELRAGRKRSHWMWFVFPQLAGLGRSVMAQRYAISGLDEARAYLSHPVLGPRLLACTQAVLDLDERDPDVVLGSVDSMKLRSSMTLFERAAFDATAFAQVLDRSFDGERDAATTRLLDAATTALD